MMPNDAGEEGGSRSGCPSTNRCSYAESSLWRGTQEHLDDYLTVPALKAFTT